MSANLITADSLPDPCVVRDGDGRILLCNDLAARLLGRTVDQLIHRRVEDIVQDPALNRWRQADKMCATGEKIVRFSIALPGPGGTTRVLSIRQRRHIDTSGEEIVVSSFREATAEYEIRHELDQREQFEGVLLGVTAEFVNRSSREITQAFSHVLEEVAQALGAGVGLFFAYDRNERKLEVQGAWSVDGDADELFSDIDPIDPSNVPWWEPLINQETFHGTGCGVTFLDQRYASCAVYPVHTQYETLGALFFASTDEKIEDRYEDSLHVMKVVALLFANVLVRAEIEKLLNSYSINLEKKVQERTQDLNIAYETLKQTQSQLVQAGKMASIGQLAAGVAHEINNPVGFVKSNLHSLKEYAEELRDQIGDAYGESLDEMDEMIADSIEGTRRVDTIVRNLRTFSRMDRGDRGLANVNDLLENTLTVIWNELKYKVEIVREYEEIPEIYCASDQLNQVFVNLLVNAVQAIEEKGEIRIHTGLDEGMVMIQIADTGQGISAEHLDRIFEPFFTTKDVGKGTGLGLSIVYDIINSHHGTISVDSIEGEGTTFTISLPINPDEHKDHLTTVV